MKYLMLVVVALAFSASYEAQADVRIIGNNVFVGGHRLKPQVFNARRRGEFYIYNRTPPKPGCYWRGNADGSRTKVCHWKRKR